MKIPDMLVSTCRSPGPADGDWHDFLKYMRAIGFSEAQVLQLRTIDRQLLKTLGRVESAPAAPESSMDALPAPAGANEFYLLAINRDGAFADFVPRGWMLVGHDLSDESLTSSLLNCGPWTGGLRPIFERLNSHGLLTEEDSRMAQKLLPVEWGDAEPHAHTVVWALYERR